MITQNVPPGRLHQQEEVILWVLQNMNMMERTEEQLESFGSVSCIIRVCEH